MEGQKFGYFLFACLLADTLAYNIFRQRIPNGEKVTHPCKSNDIWNGVGHLAEQGGGPRNNFGLDFHAAGQTWTRALCQMDSDGDGQTNGEELGDPQCTWTPGAQPSRTTGISHPGFKTPSSNYPYTKSDRTTLDCSGQYVCPGRDDPDTKSIDLRVASGTRVPSKTTTYYCSTFKVPDDQIFHAISFEPILDNLNVIHHMLVYGCKYNDAKDVKNPGECDMSSDDCRDLLGVWSLGLPGQCSPPEAGVRFGNGTYSYLQVQLHWNNPQHVNTYTDTSGIRMYYTSKLRAYDLGIIWLGQRSINIPASTPEVNITGECSPNCAGALFARGDVFVTSSISHMHLLGKSTNIEKIDKQNRTTMMVNEPVYDYNTPKWTDHRPYIRVGTEDRLKMRCTYDSSKRNKTTYYGDATDDEMCFGFLQYYPKRGDLQCVQWGKSDLCFSQATVCGPHCDLRYYLDIAVPTLNKALTECDKIRTTGVCTQDCANHLYLVYNVYTNPCLLTRYREQMDVFLSALRQYQGSFQAANRVCFSSGQPKVPTLPTVPPKTSNSSNAVISRSCPEHEGVRYTGSPEMPTTQSTGSRQMPTAQTGASATIRMGTGTGIIGSQGAGNSGSSWLEVKTLVLAVTSIISIIVNAI